jgi:small subunit ribosomal protein S18
MANVHSRRAPISLEGISIDYKELRMLRRCVSENGKISPARMTGFTRIQQRQLKKAIENARFLALIPYTVE